MDRDRVFESMRIRQIERDLLAFFPILELIMAISMTWDFYLHGVTYEIMINHPVILFSPIIWILILLLGGLIGLAFRTKFYTYYLSVSLPLQLFSIELRHLSNSYLHNDLPIVIIIIVLSLASSVFLGKILPRKRIWIF